MSSYLFMAVIVACLSVWFVFNLQSFTLNTLRFEWLFTTTTAPTRFTFYKLSLQWPPATCNSDMSCKPPILDEFTIHGLWSQYQNDTPVPPYPKIPCTSVRPTPATDLPTKLMSIEPDLKLFWPNLKDPQSLQANLYFWEHEWTDHGMCSDYPDKPRDYFNSALQLRKGLDPVMGFTPGSKYTVQTVATIVQKKVGAYPEIACNKKKGSNTLQLWEIRLCYQKAMPPITVQNCTKNYSGQCTSLTDLIALPK